MPMLIRLNSEIHGTHYAKVDYKDYLNVKDFTWSLKVSHDNRWQGERKSAVRYIQENGKQKTIYLHHEILGFPNSHIGFWDNNALNCIRDNLVAVDCTTQLWKRRKTKKPTTSIYKGVSKRKPDGKWRAYITYFGKQIHLGYHDNEIDAAKAYDYAASQFFGKFAILNLK